MKAKRWPGASWHGGATTYGPLPDHGLTQVALVLHTTETVGMPSFQGGDTAPHFTYDPRDGSWQQWADLDRYVGTMKGHSSGGHANCKAIQVEILAYSDRNACPANGTWVGDFADRHYAALADLYAWLIGQAWVGVDLTPTPDGGWRYGAGSGLRLTEGQWAAFSGLTAHGAVPLNSHWDTGVLDLEYVWLLATEDEAMDLWTIGTESKTWEEQVWNMVLAVGGTINPNQNSAQVQQWLPWKTNVRLVQVEDFDLIAQLTGMNATSLDRMKAGGMYRYGKEVAALRNLAYTADAQ
jgi:hypothetical protein